MAEDNLWDVEEISIENRKWLRYLNSPGIGLTHSICAPACEVLFVRICWNYFGGRETCEVYGDINIEDEDGTSYELYSGGPDYAETLTREHNTLSLDMPAECAVSNTWALMRICLKDKADDTVIVNDTLELDKDDYDRLKVRPVGGGAAFVSYVAFSTAVLAVVEITLIKKNDNFAAADLYGTIVARYGNTYGQKYPGIMLFYRPSSQPIRAVSNIPIELSRKVVVVPVYSFLRVDVHLSDTNQQDFNGKAEFLASHLNIYEDVDIQAKDFVIRVNVQWFHPYELENQVQKPFKRPKISTDQQVSPTFSREPYLRKHRAEGLKLLEVFTVMIGHNSNSVLNIYGEMLITDNTLMRCLVFDRNELNPETLSANSKTIPIKGPSNCFSALEYLGMGLNLRDVQGQVFIHGNIVWSFYNIEQPISWYDRRMCSICRGVNGYAAVFYTIFSEAVQAVVKVSFTSNHYTDVSHHVYGTIVARYGDESYDEYYSTEYEKAYYQSVLFKEPRGNSLELKSGCRVPLLKSVVAVPTDASLIVGVDLYASSLLGEFPQEHLKNDVKFDIVRDAHVSQQIEVKSHCIEVSVEWFDARKLYLMSLH